MSYTRTEWGGNERGRTGREAGRGQERSRAMDGTAMRIGSLYGK
jgi:hypothetical protein